MSLTPSTMLPLGTQAPDFSLPDVVSRRHVGLQDFSNKPLLVAFICNHCPYVVHIQQVLIKVSHQLLDRGLAVVAISANDAKSYPMDGPDKMADLARQLGYQFPYLYDQSQDVARAYDAACTPDFYLFDAAHRLFYRGQFDDSRPGNNIPVSGRDILSAADAVLAGEACVADQKPSVGCNIKWR